MEYIEPAFLIMGIGVCTAIIVLLTRSHDSFMDDETKETEH
jgi:hypothetical protein